MFIELQYIATSTAELREVLAETEAIEAALTRIDRVLPADENRGTAILRLAQREPNGWLEYLLHYDFYSGGKLTVGMVQRQPGAEFEFHS